MTEGTEAQSILHWTRSLLDIIGAKIVLNFPVPQDQGYVHFVYAANTMYCYLKSQLCYIVTFLPPIWKWYSNCMSTCEVTFSIFITWTWHLYTLTCNLIILKCNKIMLPCNRDKPHVNIIISWYIGANHMLMDHCYRQYIDQCNRKEGNVEIDNFFSPSRNWTNYL